MSSPQRRTTAIGTAVGTVAVLVTGIGAVSLLPGAAPVASAAALQPWEDCDALLRHYRAELVRTATAWGGDGMYFGGAEMAATGGAAVATRESGVAADAAASSAAPTGGTGQAVGTGATGTNLQEQGVDEPDRAKLVDGRLLVLSGGRLQVLSNGPRPRLLGSTALGPAETSYGGELLVAGERALVVLQGWRQPEPATAPGAAGAADAPLVEPATGSRVAVDSMIAPGTPTTRLVLLDVSGDTPRLLEEATYDGQYVSARLTGETVRLVTTSRPQVATTYPRSGGPGPEGDALRANRLAAGRAPLDAVLPQLERRTADGRVLEKGPAVDCNATSRAVGAAGAATLLVTTLQPGRGLAAVDRDAVTTDGDLVYASAERLYVATSRWGTGAPRVPVDDTVSGMDSAAGVDEVTTELHGFDISSPTSTAYVGTGSVPGYVYGRWALSAHEGALRVATTRQPPWQQDAAPEQQPASSSMVVVLDETDDGLVETGRVEGLGLTEQIKSVRYFGDLAAVVTFRQTDPLYLLDLSGTPRLLGELKVPGFSTYLHPLGDGLLLGLGQEATEEGRVTGMQASVFDVSDPAAPRQVSRVQLGQGWSPALDDSRAFVYDPQRRLAVLPFTSYDERGLQPPLSGVIGLSVDADGQLREAGRLAEPATETQVERVLLDAEGMYAVSEGRVVAVDARAYTRTGAVALQR